MRRKLMLRILFRSLWARPARTITLLAGIGIGAAVVTATLLLYLDVHAKLYREFRSYGANILLSAPAGEQLPADALQRVEAMLGSGGAAAPFGFSAALDPSGTPVVAAGTDFARARRLNSYWQVSEWPTGSNEALVGSRVPGAEVGRPMALTFAGKQLTAEAKGRLQSGSNDDTRVYIDLPTYSKWTGVGASVIEIYAPGGPEQIMTVAQKLAAAFPQDEVQPVRQIVKTEGEVFEKTTSTLLACVLIIAITVGLSVFTSLASSVLDRRRDFALMKALGASQWGTNRLFLWEVAVLGAAGGMIGYALGLGAAEWIGWQSFHFAVAPRWELLPAIFLGSALTALATAMLPLRLLRGLQPAAILKGE